MSRRLHALAWASLALAASLTAQQGPESGPPQLLRADAQRRARLSTEWLRSADPVQVAWGAWLVRHEQQTALIPLLIQKVEEYQPTEESSSEPGQRDRHDALLVVLDALIGLGAAVPVEEARKLYPEFAAQSIILLVRSPHDSQSALLEIFQDARANWSWLAAGNVLVKNRTPGFVALLLSRFTQHLSVSVVDPGVGSGSGGGGSECGFSLRGPKPGWPAVGLYQLTQFPERMTGLTATFLVGGDTTVYYWRVEPGNYDNPPDVPGSCDDGNRDRYRAQYLAKLMQVSCPQVDLDPYPQLRIVWNGAIHYREQLIAAVEEQRARFHRAVACLQESGLGLTSNEAPVPKPRLEVVIRDDRADRSAPLPAVLENNESASLRSAFSYPVY